MLFTNPKVDSNENIDLSFMKRHINQKGKTHSLIKSYDKDRESVQKI